MTERDPRLPFTQLDRAFLKPRDPVLGYVKIGGKAQTPRFTRAGKPWLPPVRYVNPPRFEVTTREKVVREVKGQGQASSETFRVDFGYKRDEVYHKAIENKAPTSLRVRLMYPTPKENVIAFLGAYGGNAWVCRGDGVTALDQKRGECLCPCPRLPQFEGTYQGPALARGDELKCRPHGQLNLLLEDAETFGGFWAFKTTSYESISNVLHFLEHMYSIFGTVAGLPFELRVQAATKSFGGGMTTQPIVSLVLAASMETARRIARDAAEESMKFLPMAPQERDAYEAAVLEEMEEEGTSYAEEFAAENIVGPAEAAEPAEDPGPDFETVDADDETEAVEAETIPPESGTAEVEAETPAPPAPAETAEEERASPAAEEFARKKALAAAVLKELSWDSEAIADRIAHHVGTDTLDVLLDRLERNYADAWTAATQGDLLEQPAEPADGLPE